MVGLGGSASTVGTGPIGLRGGGGELTLGGEGGMWEGGKGRASVEV